MVKKSRTKKESMAVKEVKQHMSALSEDFKGQVKAVAEQYIGIKDTLDSHTKILDSHTKILDSHTKILDSHTKILDSHTKKLDSHTEMIGKLTTDVETIKGDVRIIKYDLKKKVDYDEFTVLVKRVERLESKVR